MFENMCWLGNTLLVSNVARETKRVSDQWLTVIATFEFLPFTTKFNLIFNLCDLYYCFTSMFNTCKFFNWQFYLLEAYYLLVAFTCLYMFICDFSDFFNLSFLAEYVSGLLAFHLKWILSSHFIHLKSFSYQIFWQSSGFHPRFVEQFLVSKTVFIISALVCTHIRILPVVFEINKNW